MILGCALVHSRFKIDEPFSQICGQKNRKLFLEAGELFGSDPDQIPSSNN